MIPISALNHHPDSKLGHLTFITLFFIELDQKLIKYN